MNTATLTILVPLIIELMRIAEKIFTKKKAGKLKKKFVEKEAIKLYTAVEGISTGGQRKTLKVVKPAVSTAIDIFASQLFPREEH